MEEERSNGLAAPVRFVGFAAVLCLAWALVFCVPPAAVAEEEEEGANLSSGAFLMEGFEKQTELLGVDSTPPRVTSVSVSDKEAKPGDKITIDVFAEDASGVRFIDVFLVAPVNGDSRRVVMESVASSEGHFQGEFEIHEGTQAGIWKIHRIVATDMPTNTVVFYNKDFASEAYGKPVMNMSAADFEVVGTSPDLEPPQFVSISISSDVVSREEELGVAVYASDASGVEKVKVRLISLEAHEGAQFSLSPQGDHFFGDFRFIEGIRAGKWTVEWVEITDTPGNVVRVYNDRFTASANGSPVASMPSVDFSVVEEAPGDFEVVSVSSTPKVAKVGDRVTIEAVVEGDFPVAAKAQIICQQSYGIKEVGLVFSENNRFVGQFAVSNGDLPGVWRVGSLSFTNAKGEVKEVFNERLANSEDPFSIDMDSADFAIENFDTCVPDLVLKTTDYNKGCYSPYVGETDEVKWLISDESVLQFEGTEVHGPFEEEGGRYEHLLRFIPRSPGCTGVYCFVNGNLSFVKYVSVTYAAPIDINETTVRRIDAEYEYTGEPICPEPTVSFRSGGTLKEGRDYELSYENNVEPGTATVVVKAIGDAFTGEKRVDFQIVGQEEPGLQDFLDVAPGSWYYEPVTYAASRGLVQGYGDTGLFGPDDTLTRAQAAVILCRYFAPEMDLDDYQDNRTGMADVEGYAWYTNAANWAVGTGVIGGRVHPDGTASFDPHDTITREELCTVIARTSQAPTGPPCSRRKVTAR